MARRRTQINLRKCKAFTVVELIVVMSVIGTVSAIAVPRYVNFLAQGDMAAAANRIVVDLAYAQQRARLTGQAQTVTFDLARSAYTFDRIDDISRSNVLYTVNLAEAPYDVDIQTANLGGDTALIFDVYGRPDSGGIIRVGSSKYRKLITVDSQTGKANSGKTERMSPIVVIP